MGKYVAESLVKSLIKVSIPVRHARVAILGFTFKENCPDTRNTKVIDIYKELGEYGIHPIVVDPAADAAISKVIRVYTNAVPADQPRHERQKIPFRTRRPEHFRKKSVYRFWRKNPD